MVDVVGTTVAATGGTDEVGTGSVVVAPPQAPTTRPRSITVAQRLMVKAYPRPA